MLSLFFLDACALARYYFQDIGTRLVQQIWTYPDSMIVYDWLILTEAVSVFAQTKRDTAFPHFDEEAYHSARSALLQASEKDHLRLNLNPVHWPESVDLLSRHPLRSADAVHLAAALILARSLPASEAKLVFVTSDQRLYRAAQAEGIELLHLWSCQCSKCGHIFVAQKGIRQECPQCGKVCERCSLRYCDNQITLAGVDVAVLSDNGPP